MKARILGLAGGICWLVAVLTHVAERLHFLPGMGWGRPNSPGHYLDLVSGVVGALLVLAALLVRYLPNRNRRRLAPEPRRAACAFRRSGEQ